MFHHKVQQQFLILGALGTNVFCVLNAQTCFLQSLTHCGRLGSVIRLNDPSASDLLVSNPRAPLAPPCGPLATR